MSLNDLERGTKHDLILAIMAKGFTYRKAQQILESLLHSLTQALCRGERVEIDGFGEWMVQPLRPKRAWRFGKVITQRNRRVAFRYSGPSLSDLKVRNRKQTKSATDLLTAYTSKLREFLLDDMHAEDYRQFWTLRWHSPWFESAYLNEIKKSHQRYTIENVRKAIDSTRPMISMTTGPTRSIDFVTWYGHWTGLLDVDRELWLEAERIVSRQF